MNNKFCSMLGFCAKAGKCVFGEDAVSASIKSGKAALVLVSDAASENTIKKMRDRCAYRDVPLLVCAQDIGAACGKPGRMIVAVTDKTFANNIQMLYTQCMGV